MPTDTALVPHARPATLYEIEDTLAALIDTEEFVSAEQQEEFERDLAEQLQRAVAKRDRMAEFIRHCEAQAEFAGQEIARLHSRKRTFERAAERARGFILRVIHMLGPDPKGKLRKLEGSQFTMSARRNQSSLTITNEAAIPERYKSVVMRVTPEVFRRMQAAGEVQAALAWETSTEAVKRALLAGEEVEGAHLVTDRFSLQIR